MKKKLKLLIIKCSSWPLSYFNFVAYFLLWWDGLVKLVKEALNGVWILRVITKHANDPTINTSATFSLINNNPTLHYSFLNDYSIIKQMHFILNCHNFPGFLIIHKLLILFMEDLIIGYTITTPSWINKHYIVNSISLIKINILIINICWQKHIKYLII